jgi:N-acetylglucosamine-6-phosphate deacetylase
MTLQLLGVRAALVEGNVVPGDVSVDGGTVLEVGLGGGVGGTGIACPGFIDLQVNGFAGVDFLATDAQGYRQARRALAATGVTAFQPTLISSPPDVFEAALAVVADAQREPGPRILGAHLEGPFLAPKWKGAHDERYIIDPDLRLAARLWATGPLTYMTIAPERPGARALQDWLLAHDVTVSLGHTDADAEIAHAAYNRGAHCVTHLFNAQRRFTARDPGVAGVALTRPDVGVEVIADFVHLAPETVRLIWQACGPRLILITDAIAAAGCGDGEYRLGDRSVYVTDGAARLADGTLAGSVLALDQAVRNLISLGVPWGAAVAAATAAPAHALGRTDLGVLRPGSRADIAVLDDDARVLRTLVGGEEVWPGDVLDIQPGPDGERERT